MIPESRFCPTRVFQELYFVVCNFSVFTFAMGSWERILSSSFVIFQRIFKALRMNVKVDGMRDGACTVCLDFAKSCFLRFQNTWDLPNCFVVTFQMYLIYSRRLVMEAGANI